MTNQEIDQTIGEAIGAKPPIQWYASTDGGKSSLLLLNNKGEVERWIREMNAAYPEGHTKGAEVYEYKVWPRYHDDLNAMHEAENTLNESHYRIFIDYLVGELNAGEFSVRAPASKRAEAFLKTLGKWKES